MRERRRVENGLHRRAGLTQRRCHVYRAVNRRVGVIRATDHRQDVACARIHHDDGSIVGIALRVSQVLQAAIDNLFSRALQVEVERRRDDPTAAQKRFCAKLIFELVADVDDKMRRGQPAMSNKL